MSKQQADKEMTSIRRILDILDALAPSGRARVLAFVNDRTTNPPLDEPTTPPVSLKDVKLRDVQVTPMQLPFPGADQTKKALDEMAGAAQFPISKIEGAKPGVADYCERHADVKVNQ